MRSNREVKLIFLNGEYSHSLSTTVSSVKMSFPDIDETDMIAFATSVLQTVAQHDEYILDGLVRVDLFRNDEGELVVNELEGLEARFFTTVTNKLTDCQHWLENYWEKKILTCIETFAA